jgi:multidrug resistance efflux pump
MARRALKSARAQVAGAEQRLALLEEGSRKEDIAEAKAALAEAEAQVKLMESGYRVEDLARAAAQVAAAQAAVSAIEVRLTELTVAAPCDCVVEAIDLRPGDLVSPNAPSVALLNLAELRVRAYVPESRLGQVRPGMKVPVVVDSFPTERFMGHVTFISRDAEFTPRNVQTPEERSKQVFRIKVKLEQGLDRLRAGMAADVLLGEAAD